eukprot:gene46515-58001_t
MGNGGPATSAALNFPTQLYGDTSGNLYFPEYYSNIIRVINLNTKTISTVPSAQLSGPFGIWGLSTGTLYIAETAGRRVIPYGVFMTSPSSGYIADMGGNKIRQILDCTPSSPPSTLPSLPPSGPPSASPTFGSYTCVSTLAGTGTASSQSDGTLAKTATVNGPRSVWADSSGNTYISDTGGNAVRMVSASSGLVSRVAGLGTVGSTGDGGRATSARLDSPNQLFGDTSNSLYFADGNTLRVVSLTTNLISIFAGGGSAAASGSLATSTILNQPWGVWADTSGNVYFSEMSGLLVQERPQPVWEMVDMRHPQHSRNQD